MCAMEVEPEGTRGEASGSTSMPVKSHDDLASWSGRGGEHGEHARLVRINR